MSSVLIERVATHISSLGFGTLGVDIFGGTIPTTPYELIGVRSTGGFSRSRDPMRKPSFQIVLRTDDTFDGMSKITSLSAALSNANSLMCVMPGFFEQQGDPGPHFRDDNGHLVFTLNYVYSTTRIK